jgi:molybdopterin-guanine dinucleotide biosynthesis protein A
MTTAFGSAFDSAPGPRFDAVVLAGGAARRLGGADKPALRIGGSTLLDRVLAGCAGARTTIVVGPERETARPVRWVREQPPGGGPVAAIAAALPLVTADAVLLLAADLPFFDAATASRLLAALDAGDEGDPGPAAAVLTDADGRAQPLAAAYRTAPLRAALARLPDPAGLALRRLVGELPTRQLADVDRAAEDCDTWEQVERAEARAHRTG